MCGKGHPGVIMFCSNKNVANYMIGMEEAVLKKPVFSLKILQERCSAESKFSDLQGKGGMSLYTCVHPCSLWEMWL